MDLGKTLVLGLIAGSTIVLGLPIGRLQNPRPTLKVFLNATAIGVLLFLTWDVLSQAWEPIDTALGRIHDHTGGYAPAFGWGVLFAAGLAVGLLSLVSYDRFMDARRAAATRPAEPEIALPASSGTVLTMPPATKATKAWSPARRLALLIATGIGLHNFAEGLAIGQSAARNEVALATMLVIGFGLHNATEGFGIVAPLAADRDEDGRLNRPSWGFLLTLGLIGGGPTFLGTFIGHGFTSEQLSVIFLTLAAGSIVYVVIQLIGVASRARRTDLVCYGVLLGLLAGFITDAVVTVAGA